MPARHFGGGSPPSHDFLPLFAIGMILLFNTHFVEGQFLNEGQQPLQSRRTGIHV